MIKLKTILYLKNDIILRRFISIPFDYIAWTLTTELQYQIVDIKRNILNNTRR